MARPTKSGIDYFPLDCEWDNKVEMYIAEKESTGLAVLVTLWQLIYKNSYYLEFNNDLILLIKKRINVDINSINDCINSAVDRGIFDKRLFESGILTSKAIQKRFFEAAKRKKAVQVDEDFLLIDVSAYNNLINVNINPINVRINATKLDVKVNVKGKLDVKLNESAETNSKPSNDDLPLPLLTEEKQFQPQDFGNKDQVTESIKHLLNSFCNISEPKKEEISSFVNVVMNTKNVKNQTAFKYVYETFNEFNSYSAEKRNLKYLYSRVKGRIDDALIIAREERAKAEKENERKESALVVNSTIEQIANKFQIN